MEEKVYCNNLKLLEENLKNIFKCNFKVKDNYGLIEIIYDDKNIDKNPKYLDEILKIASKYLDQKRLWDIGLVYDYLKEIDAV